MHTNKQVHTSCSPYLHEFIGSADWTLKLQGVWEGRQPGGCAHHSQGQDRQPAISRQGATCGEHQPDSVPVRCPRRTQCPECRHQVSSTVPQLLRQSLQAFSLTCSHNGTRLGILGCPSPDLSSLGLFASSRTVQLQPYSTVIRSSAAQGKHIRKCQSGTWPVSSPQPGRQQQCSTGGRTGGCCADEGGEYTAAGPSQQSQSCAFHLTPFACTQGFFKESAPDL